MALVCPPPTSRTAHPPRVSSPRRAFALCPAPTAGRLGPVAPRKTRQHPPLHGCLQVGVLRGALGAVDRRNDLRGALRGGHLQLVERYRATETSVGGSWLLNWGNRTARPLQQQLAPRRCTAACWPLLADRAESKPCPSWHAQWLPSSPPRPMHSTAERLSCVGWGDGMGVVVLTIVSEAHLQSTGHGNQMTMRARRGAESVLSGCSQGTHWGGGRWSTPSQRRNTIRNWK